MTDVQNKSDIKTFVDDFYRKVRIDPLLGPVFAAKIPDDNWEPHLNRMYGFWNTVLFNQREYSGNPFSKHAPLPIDGPHFNRWIELFKNTIDEHFEGEKASEAIERATKMALLFESKLNYIRNNPQMKNIV